MLLGAEGQQVRYQIVKDGNLLGMALWTLGLGISREATAQDLVGTGCNQTLTGPLITELEVPGVHPVVNWACGYAASYLKASLLLKTHIYPRGWRWGWTESFTTADLLKRSVYSKPHFKRDT